MICEHCEKETRDLAEIRGGTVVPYGTGRPCQGAAVKTGKKRSGTVVPSSTGWPCQTSVPCGWRTAVLWFVFGKCVWVEAWPRG